MKRRNASQCLSGLASGVALLLSLCTPSVVLSACGTEKPAAPLPPAIEVADVLQKDAPDAAFRVGERRRHPDCQSFAARYPARTLPVNASHAASRPPSHDSGPAWFAAPSLYETLTRNTLPAYPDASRLSSRTSADFSQVSLDISSLVE